MLTLTEEQLAKIQERIKASSASVKTVLNVNTEKELELRPVLSANGKKSAEARKQKKMAQDQAPLTITLPWPPSVNTYWRHPRSGPLAGRHLVSREGRLYRAQVKELVFYERKIYGRIAVHIEAYPPDKRKRDLDNILKSLLDSIMHAALIQDDSMIDDLQVVRQNELLGKVVVTIRAL